MDALSDCYAAISLDGGYLRARQRRAEILAALGDHGAAAQVRPACTTLEMSSRQLHASAALLQEKACLCRALATQGCGVQLFIHCQWPWNKL